MPTLAKTVWLTGLPASGKTTLAVGLHDLLEVQGVPSVLIDGDEFRKAICTDLGYYLEDRLENIRRAASMARMVNDSGIIAICSFVSPTVGIRNLAKSIIGEGRYIEVYVSTPLVVCEQRDPRGLYVKARKGLIADLTGIDSPFDPPHAPFYSIDTSNLSPSEAIARLASRVETLFC